MRRTLLPLGPCFVALFLAQSPSLFAEDHQHGSTQPVTFETTTAPLDIPGDDSGALSAAQIFERRVLPITKSGQGSSCTECHFGGVELANYIRADQAATFAALREEGLVDVESPEKSRLLEFIRRRPVKEDELLARVRRNEYAALHAWILAAVQDPSLLKAKSTNVQVGTELPVEVVRYLRRDRVLDSFVENVWFELGRCVGCHSPDKNERLVAKHGEKMSWIVPNDPAGTLQQCAERGIIDLASPAESMLVTKPSVREEHGGGPKFLVGSRSDQQFLRFLQDYASTVNGDYKSAADLPAPPPEVVALTSQHLRITGLPAHFAEKLLQVDLYCWTDAGWAKQRVATADGPVGKQQQWQNIVAVVAPRGSAAAREALRTRQLPAGRYLMRVYVDRHDQRRENADYKFTPADMLGEIEIQGDWPPGYQPPKIVEMPHRR